MAERKRHSIFRRAFLRAAVSVERGVDAVKGHVEDRFDRGDPIQILAYRGYGTRERWLICGRVLQDEPIGAEDENDTIWQNLGNTWRRFESDEVPGARLRVRAPGWEQEVVTDEEGYFQAQIEPAVSPSVEPGSAWQTVELELLDPAPGVRASASVLVPPADAELGVISDIDDTVVETGVTDPLVLLRTVLKNARTRLPFKGVAAFYQALVEGRKGTGSNPIFYVSGSPWNLYDLLAEFMDLQSIPRGPLLLRDFGLDIGKLIHEATDEHKLGCIRSILDLYPKLHFILIGDSGEQDPEIYRRVVREYPGRILAIYIRRIGVGPSRDDQVLALAKEVREEGVPMLQVEDTEAAAVHARESGWIRPEQVPQVQQEKIKDEVAPSPTEVALKPEG